VSVHEIQRILVPPPMSATPYDGVKPCKPVDCKGERIQVTVFHDESNHVLERWQFSETDVRWYRLEAYTERHVRMRITVRKAVGA
jgi:hypothetical protein